MLRSCAGSSAQGQALMFPKMPDSRVQDAANRGKTPVRFRVDAGRVGSTLWFRPCHSPKVAMIIALPAGPGQSAAEFAVPSPPPGLLGRLQMQSQVVARRVL